MLARLRKWFTPEQAPLAHTEPVQTPQSGMIPATPIRQILATYAAQITALREATGVPEETYQKYYRPLIEQYARMVHLLPASEVHHHRHMGGLLLHGLESAAHAVRRSEDILVAGMDLPRQRKLIESRFRWAVFAAALLHDAGKPLSDLVVSDATGDRIWQPLRQSLVDWLDATGVSGYHVTWRSSRHRRHEGLALQMAMRIVPDTLWAYVAEAGPELLAELQSAIGRAGAAQGKLAELAAQADQESVTANLRTAMGPGVSGFPAEQLVIDGMRRMLSDGLWAVNTEDARVWVLSDGAYVVWPLGAIEVVRRLIDDGIRGIPRDPDLLAALLVERNLAHRNEHRNTWDIRPAPLTQKLPNAYLRALRFAPDTLFSVPPPAIPSAPDPRQATPEPAAPTQKAQPKRESPAQETVPAAQQRLPFDTPAPPAPKATHGTVPTAPETTEHVMVPAPGEVALPADDAGAAAEWLDRTPKPLLRQIFLALIADLKKGARREGVDLVWQLDGTLALAWPDALKGYGVEQRDLLACLQESKWIVPDAANPLRNITDIEFTEGTRKALVIVPEASARLRTLAGPRSAWGAKPAAPTARPVDTTTAHTPDSDLVQDLLARTAAYGPEFAAHKEQGVLVVPRAALTRYANDTESRVARVREALLATGIEIRVTTGKSGKKGAS